MIPTMAPVINSGSTVLELKALSVLQKFFEDDANGFGQAWCLHKQFVAVACKGSATIDFDNIDPTFVEQVVTQILVEAKLAVIDYTDKVEYIGGWRRDHLRLSN